MPLETTVVRATPDTHATALLILLVPEGGMPASLAAVDGASGGALGRLFGGTFLGKKDETALLYPEGPASRILVVGTGKTAEGGRNSLRRGAAVGGRQAAGQRVPTAACFAAPEAWGDASAADVGQVLVEGLSYGAWSNDAYKQPPTEPRVPLDHVEILAPVATKEIEGGHRVGAAIAAGQALTRDLQFLPSNRCTPTYLAEVATDMASRLGLKVTILDKDAIVAEEMGGLLAVAEGSTEEPRFIILEHAGGSGAPVVLVGKGVTFDTGGISIKPAANMEEMKFDMSGAAAVLGAMEAIGRLKPKAPVVALVPATENMPSGDALKPGDVITSHFGKTVEVINTDAEGRLILMDALSYARRFKPACVLDAATLTGAVVVALGPHAAGIMGNDDGLVEEARAAGERAGERVWPLPLWDDYRDLLKSEIADVKNTGGRQAGTITAGWFLREFVDGFPWAHIDIAGTAYTDRALPTMGKGPTGMGVRLFSEFVLARAH